MAPLLLVGFAASAEDDTWAFHFQCDLRVNSYLEESNWPEGESYCVTNQGGFTCYGCVREAEVRDRTVRVVFTEKAVRDLRLDDDEFRFDVGDAGVDVDEIARELRRVLTCGRPEYRPRLIGFPGDE